jgi:hypothetical protein
MAPVERYEVDPILFGGRGDQGVRKSGAMTRPEVPPVVAAKPCHSLGNGQSGEGQEKLLQ